MKTSWRKYFKASKHIPNRSLYFEDIGSNPPSFKLGLHKVRIMEEQGKGWDLARQDLLAQYLKNSVTLPSVGISAKEMYWNIRLCLILFRCELLVFAVCACGDSLMASGDEALWHLCPWTHFREASMHYLVFTADPLQKETNICELASSIMCPPENTARGKTLLGFFLFLSLEMKTRLF